jgi:hypothetical protein
LAAEQFAASDKHYGQRGELSGRSRELRTKSGMPAWGIVAIASVSLLVLLLVIVMSSKGSPEDSMTVRQHIDMAKDFGLRQQHDRALAQLDAAFGKQPTIQEAKEIKTHKDKITEALKLRADMEVIGRASNLVNWMEKYAKQNVEGRSEPRPGARVLVGECRIWLSEFEPVMRRHESTVGEVGKVRGFLSQYEAVAQMESPSTADDVIALATHHHINERFGPARDALRQWLASNGENEKVREKLEGYVTEGDETLDRLMMRADDDMKRRRWTNSKKWLTTIIEKSGIPERVAAAQSKLVEVEQRERESGGR